jgi:hypothetical protein
LTAAGVVAADLVAADVLAVDLVVGDLVAAGLVAADVLAVGLVARDLAAACFAAADVAVVMRTVWVRGDFAAVAEARLPCCFAAFRSFGDVLARAITIDGTMRSWTRP